MNKQIKPDIVYSACPHDCPSCCALEVERLDEGTIGRVRGAKDQTYTAGVICAKVARYAERIHHPDRLTHPLRRTGDKGSGAFERISWDDALDLLAEKMLEAETKYGPEAVWPYYYAGTMGLVQRDGINRLRHAKKYSGMHQTFCSALSSVGFMAGTGKIAGPDPREMAKSDLVIIWGTNPVNTQVNVMTHVAKARKSRNAKMVAIDVYQNATMKQADLALCLKPGTDAALACALMHILFRDGFADREYLEKYTDCPADLEEHLKTRGPEWAAAITGLAEADIETLARWIGETPKSYFRLGYGFTRSRNGAVSMHAASCVPAITGAWRHEGGGAFHGNGGIYRIKKTLIEGNDVRDPDVRVLDMSRIGAVLCGDASEIGDGPPVTVLFTQNTNPASVAPDQTRVHMGLAREDLFTCVHEQFMTETAKFADLVLPATMFLEHDDLYVGNGHQYLQLGPKVIEAPGECRSNHEVLREIANRVGAEHPGFEMTAREMIDTTLRDSGRGTWDELEEIRWLDCQPDFDEAHYLNGFAWPDNKFRFRPDWGNVPVLHAGTVGPFDQMPELPDYWDVIETGTDECPFRLATSPARSFLNSTFNETATSLAREGRPEVMIHPGDAAQNGIKDGDKVRLGNARGTVILHASIFDGVQRGVLVAESIWPNDSHEGGVGLNALTGADAAAPFGGAAFHDNRVWIKPYLSL